jgi:hypothetical protein
MYHDDISNVNLENLCDVLIFAIPVGEDFLVQMKAKSQLLKIKLLFDCILFAVIYT